MEYKNVADAQTGIMLFLEIQEGKEAMAGIVTSTLNLLLLLSG